MSVPRELEAWIRERGQVSFEEFMTFVLYEPGFGYYQRHVPGDDYRTSPTISPVFGQLVAKALAQFWRSLGEPGVFDVVEIGPGSGHLASSALDAIGSDLPVTWKLVEPFAYIAERQRALLGERALWFDKIEDLGEVEGCLIANEVLDNFPVKLFEVGNQGVEEVFVGMDAAGLVEILVPSDEPTPEGLEPGDRFEVSPHVAEWVDRLSAIFKAGRVIIIDYGDVEPDLHLRRPTGTLLTYGPLGIGTDPLEDPGELDITAHVNFTRLAFAFESRGFSTKLSDQRSWLKSLGADDIAARLLDDQRRAEGEGRHADALSFMSTRSKLTSLVAPGGLGDLMVLDAIR